MKSFLATLGMVIGLCASTQAQTTYTAYFPDNLTTGSSNAFPWNTGATTGYTTVNIYPAATMLAQGIPAGAHLNGVALMPQAGSGSMTMPTAKVFIGHAAATTGPTLWINNMADPTTLWDTTIDGPLTTPGWTALTWAPVPVRGNNCFFWDGVRDVVLMFSQGGGYTGAYSVTSAANLYTRHGVTTFMPAPGTTQTTTGVLGPRLRLIFDNNSPFAATTSGNGTGDFTMALGALAPGIVEGYTLLSSTTTGAQGAGPLFGIYPDLLTFSSLSNTPAGFGDPLHWIASPSIPGIWPAAPFQLPAGTLSFLAGQRWDAVVVAFGPNFNPIQTSCVSRINW